MICKECGAYNPDHATYCKVCAASLKEAPETVISEEPVAEQQPTKRFSRPSWVTSEASELSQPSLKETAQKAEEVEQAAEAAEEEIQAAPEAEIEEPETETVEEPENSEIEEETPVPIWTPSQSRRRTAVQADIDDDDDNEEEPSEDNDEDDSVYHDDDALEDDESFEYEPTPPKRKSNKKKNNTMFTVLLIAIIVVIVGILVLGGYWLLKDQLKCSNTPKKDNAETAAVTTPDNSESSLDPVTPAQDNQPTLDSHNAQLQETIDENSKELIAVTVVVPSGSTVTIDFPNQDDYKYTNSDSKDVTRKVKIPVEVFYPNYPLDEPEVEITPKIMITNADGSSYQVNCPSFTRTFPKLNISVTAPVPDENGMIMAPESNVISISGTVDDPSAEVTINGVVTSIYMGGVFMYDYKFDENATEDTEDTITISASKNNCVTDTKEITVHAYKYIPQPMTLEVNNNGKSIHTDNNGKVTVTGKTLPGAELTATSNNTTNVLCGGVTVDPEGNFSFQITTDASFFGMSTITIDAKKEGADSATTKFTITKGFKDKESFVKFYNKTKTYIEMPKHGTIPQLLANQAQYATNAYGFRIEGTVVEVITIDGETIVKMNILKSNETVYVRNYSEKWAPGDNVGGKYRIYCNFVGTYSDTECAEFIGWFAKVIK